MDAAVRVAQRSRFATARRRGIAGVPLGDLFALANAIAGIVGGAVTMRTRRRVLGYSTLGDQPIDAGRRLDPRAPGPGLPGMRTLYREVPATPGVMTANGASCAGSSKAGGGGGRPEVALGRSDPRRHETIG